MNSAEIPQKKISTKVCFILGLTLIILIVLFALDQFGYLPHKVSENTILFRLASKLDNYGADKGHLPKSWKELKQHTDLSDINDWLKQRNLPAPIEANYFFLSSPPLEAASHERIILIRKTPIIWNGRKGRFFIKCGTHLSGEPGTCHLGFLREPEALEVLRTNSVLLRINFSDSIDKLAFSHSWASKS